MEEFLNKNCYIKIDVAGKIFYYLDAIVTNISETHISFNDTTRFNEPHTYRIKDIIEIRFSKSYGVKK
jgi:hypothetical protein